MNKSQKNRFSAIRCCLPLLVVFTSWVCLPLSAARGQATGLLAKEQQAFRAAVAEVAPCVVQIETFGGLEMVGDKEVPSGPTTGTILSADGWIISSLYSFRQNPASILVNLPDGERAPARIVARDFNRELALLKVDGIADLPHVDWPDPESEVSAAVGQWVIALGKTYDRQQVSQSVGILSALGRAYDRAIQTDAKISPINYGGPLIDLRGRVLGVLAPITPGSFFDGDSSELYDSGIGFAVPLTDIRQRLPRLQDGEDLRAGKLGIVTASQNELLGPVKVVGAMPGSPAGKAGVRSGDVIVEAEGAPVGLLAHLRHALTPRDAGDAFAFVVERDGQRLELSATLSAEIPTYERRYLGLRLKVSDSEDLVITGIEPDSPAAKAGLELEQRLLAINGASLADGEAAERLSRLKAEIAISELDAPLRLDIQEQEQARQVEVQPVVWPTQLPEQLPPPDDQLDDKLSSEVVDVNLSDVPNQAYAVVAPQADRRNLGLVIVFPEPGQLKRETTLAAWQDFCAAHGWIVAVINSSNPRSWTMEELGLAERVLGRMQQAYSIDDSRIVLAGLGVGGRMALVSSSMLRDRVAGVLMSQTELRGLEVKQKNSPLSSLDYLLVGEPTDLNPAAEKLRTAGYSAIVVASPQTQAMQWETYPIPKMQLWLEGLGRY